VQNRSILNFKTNLPSQKCPIKWIKGCQYDYKQAWAITLAFTRRLSHF